jgi:hypothetical protein
VRISSTVLRKVRYSLLVYFPSSRARLIFRLEDGQIGIVIECKLTLTNFFRKQLPKKPQEKKLGEDRGTGDELAFLIQAT